MRRGVNLSFSRIWNVGGAWQLVRRYLWEMLIVILSPVQEEVPVGVRFRTYSYAYNHLKTVKGGELNFMEL